MKVLFSPCKKAKELALGKAKELLGADYVKHPDFLLVEKPEKIEDILPVIEAAATLPMYAEAKVVVILGIDGLRNDAQDKLLKILEDCQHLHIIATQNVEGRLLPTILSRMVYEQVVDRVELSSAEGVATNGTAIQLPEGAVKVLNEVVVAFDGNKPLRDVLHLVAEKDKGHYFDLYGKDGALCLFQLLAALIYTYIAKYISVEIETPSKLCGDYPLDCLDKASFVVEAAISKLKTQSYLYGSNEFYLDVYNIERRLGER